MSDQYVINDSKNSEDDSYHKRKLVGLFLSQIRSDPSGLECSNYPAQENEYVRSPRK